MTDTRQQRIAASLFLVKDVSPKECANLKVGFGDLVMEETHMQQTLESCNILSRGGVPELQRHY